MEQGIGCSNHPDKNAIRLCDSCDMPFCAECLRKNLLGFYYCQRCYPRLFENTPAPEYEIPRDEKGLRRIQKQVDLSFILDSIYESLKTSITGGIIIGFCLFLLNFIIVIIVTMHVSNADLFSFFKWSILSTIITYFLAGLCCGKFWPENPWRWGFWLTVPYGFAVLLLIISFRDAGGDRAYAGLFLLIYIFLYFVLILISSAGAYVGVHIGAKSCPCPIDKKQNNN